MTQLRVTEHYSKTHLGEWWQGALPQYMPLVSLVALDAVSTSHKYQFALTLCLIINPLSTCAAILAHLIANVDIDVEPAPWGNGLP